MDLQGTEFVAGGLFDDRYGLNTGIARVFDLTPAIDCDGDGVCDLPQQYDPAFDCDGNGVADTLDIAACDGDPGCLDCNGNGRPDRCDLVDRSGPFFPAVGYWRLEDDGTNLGFSDLPGDLRRLNGFGRILRG